MTLLGCSVSINVILCGLQDHLCPTKRTIPWEEGIHNKKHEHMRVSLQKPAIYHVLGSHGLTEDKPGSALKIGFDLCAEI